jgi:hypothetical protein
MHGHINVKFPIKLIWTGHGQHSPGTDTALSLEIYANSDWTEALAGSYVRVTVNIRDKNKDKSFMYNREQWENNELVLI